MPVISAKKEEISYNESTSYSVEGDFNGTFQYTKLPFACGIFKAGYDEKEFHLDIYIEVNMLPIIIRKTSMKLGLNLADTGTYLCPFGYPTRRKAIEYNR